MSLLGKKRGQKVKSQVLTRTDMVKKAEACTSWLIGELFLVAFFINTQCCRDVSPWPWAKANFVGLDLGLGRPGLGIN